MNPDTKEFLKSLPAPLASKSFSYLLAYFLFAAAVHLFDSFFPGLFPQWFRDFGFQLFLLGALVVLWRQGWRPQLQSSWSSILWFALLLGGYFGLLYLFELTAQGLGFEAWPHQRSESVPRMILMILMAPILEELFFRDFLLRAFYWQMNRFRRAVFFSSAFFMLAHLSLYPGAFLLGVVNACLFAVFRSVWPAIVFHAVSNLSLFFLPRFFPAFTEALRQIEILPFFHP